LGPALAQLRGRTELGIVPDGPLWELPFQALPISEDGFLVQDFAVFYAPSLAVLRETVKRKHEQVTAQTSPPAQPAARTLLAFGNPTAGKATMQRIDVAYRSQMLVPLLEAEKEVQALALLYGSERSTVYTRFRAREDTLKSEAGNYQLIHLATHSILDDQNPLYSRVLLAQPSNEGSEDGLLEAWEVMKLNLHADLVVLSACQTARGRVGAGEGVIGMSWAFFVAGAPTLVVSQWEVDSASTTALMLEFHRNLIAGSNEAGGISRAEALRRAQLKLLQGKSFRRPFFWAAFVVMGNGV
jgi:CHAT domain-containing protein